MPENARTDGYAYALRLLARREYSEHELRVKLGPRADPAETDRILARLKDAGLQSDARCAETLVRHYAEEGWGRRRIFYEAGLRGVGAELVRGALAAAGIDWAERAAAAARRRRLSSGTPAEKHRALMFLARRGFDSAEAEEGLRRAARAGSGGGE